VNPRSYWTKTKIAEWMKRRSVPLPPLVTDPMQMLKATMLQLCKKYHREEVFIVEEIIARSKKDIKLLFLPVAHCELNPIELIWALAKG